MYQSCIYICGALVLTVWLVGQLGQEAIDALGLETGRWIHIHRCLLLLSILLLTGYTALFIITVVDVITIGSNYANNTTCFTIGDELHSQALVGHNSGQVVDLYVAGSRYHTAHLPLL